MAAARLGARHQASRSDAAMTTMAVLVRLNTAGR